VTGAPAINRGVNSPACRRKNPFEEWSEMGSARWSGGRGVREETRDKRTVRAAKQDHIVKAQEPIGKGKEASLEDACQACKGLGDMAGSVGCKA